MNVNIPAALMAVKNSPFEKTCYLLKIVTRSDDVLAVAGLDRDVEYEDGGGEITYSAPIGVDASARQASGEGEVDDAEATLLLLDSGGFTDEKIHAGVFDYARFWVYEINWADPSMGHRLVHYGVTGAMKVQEGLAGVIELRGLQQLLKQSIVKVYSLTCRHRFGSFGDVACNFDASSLWDAGSVASVDTEEPERIFTATTAPTASGPNGSLDEAFVPGLIRFTGGQNAGLTAEIEEVEGSVIKLRFPAPYDIAPTDTYEARPDCAKRWQEDCIDKYDNRENFGGEFGMPLGDEGQAHTPGARLGHPPSPVLLPDPDPPPPPPEPDPDPPPPDPDPPESTDLVNPGFEDGDTGWAKGVGWSITGSSPRTGSKSAELYSANVPSSIRQATHFPVSPSQNVSGSCYVKSGAPASVGGRAVLTWYDVDHVFLGEDFGNTVTSSSYQQSTVNANAPGAAAFVTLGCESVTSTFGNPLFADDFAWNL